MLNRRELPLLSLTPDSWALDVLKQPVALLNDHAHLEKKAASNSLELLARWPDGFPSSRWIHAVSGVTKDEMKHFIQVVKLLEKRGGSLSRGHKNAYAQELRKLVRLGTGERELVDRLMVTALLEVRSCERFEVLGRNAEDPELKKLYRALWASEHGHYKTFLTLGTKILSEREVTIRWNEFLREEAKILERQTPGPRIHSGVPT